MPDKEKDNKETRATKETKESVESGGFHIYNTEAQRAAALAQTGLRSDRALYLDASKSKIVDMGDPSAAFLLVAAGGVIPLHEAERLNLDVSGGKVTQKSAAKVTGNDAVPIATDEAEKPKAEWRATPPPEVVLNMAPEHTSPDETPEGSVPASEQTSPTLRTAFNKDKAREIREAHPVLPPVKREPVEETPTARAATTRAATPVSEPAAKPARKSGAKKGRT